jgi:hypothetical protein
MELMPDMDTNQYNQVYSAVAFGLETAENVNIAICPNNDQALWSKYCALSLPAKRGILAMMRELEKDTKKAPRP